MTCEGGSSASPEGPVRGEEFVLDLGEGANDLDWLLAGAEDRPRREAHGRVLGVVAGLREELRILSRRGEGRLRDAEHAPLFPRPLHSSAPIVINEVPVENEIGDGVDDHLAHGTVVDSSAA